MTQTRGTLDRELAQIQDKVLELASYVEQAILRSVDALKRRDIELARQIIADDQKINVLRYTIEEMCLTVIATQQPVAGDLRRIIGSMHIAIEMERMADHAEGNAHLGIRMADQPLLKPLIDIPRMADLACKMLRAGMDAYLAADAEAAQELVKIDDEIDALYQQVLRELLTFMIQDPKSINRGTFLLWVAHNLERIGDRAVNIGERVIFMTTGRFKELDGSWSEHPAEQHN